MANIFSHPPEVGG